MRGKTRETTKDNSSNQMQSTLRKTKNTRNGRKCEVTWTVLVALPYQS